MQRVVVFGYPGAGKTMFSRRLAAIIGLPYVSLDAHFWKPGWVERESAEFRALVAPVVAQDAWVMDGNYFAPLGTARIERATHLIWFDISRWQCMLGLLSRIVRHYGQVRPDMAPGCPERLNWSFIRFAWSYKNKQRPRFLELLALARPDQTALIFTRRGEADAFLSRLSPSVA